MILIMFLKAILLTTGYEGYLSIDYWLSIELFYLCLQRTDEIYLLLGALFRLHGTSFRSDPK